MYSHHYSIRIRYSDTDQMGIVYYGNYATFYEIGRVEALRALGFSYREMEERGIMLPVIESHSKFLQPAAYDEVITIKTTVSEMPEVRMKFDFELYNEAERCIHTGHTTLVFVKKDTNRPCRAPKDLLDLLQPFFQQVSSNK